MEMNEFCGLKGIKGEISVARTPQQNGVAERKNMTLIEVFRTMLADSLLPTVFWAEADNTACYVLNRVLVTKPHNKIPYELIIGRPPSISFMRPFGCPVTILNTLDSLGKFDGKADEGFLVGYSVNSKAFRVFNIETRKVKENLHVNFLENKPNVAGQGPNWLFDIDSLTNSMNYQPVTAGNQTNKNTGPQETNGDTGLKKNVDDGQTEKENVSTQQYILFPLWSSICSSYKSSDEKDGDDTANDVAEKEATEQSDAFRKVFGAQFNAANASRTFGAAGPSFVPFGGYFPIDVTDLPDDPLMLDLEDTTEIQSTGIFGSAYDDDDQVVGVEADFNNMEPSIVVSPIPTTRVEAIQEELLQFKIQKVWTLVDLPYGKKAIGTKWVYRNKKDAIGIMDVKSAFLYGTIEEEVYVCQPPGFVDLEFLEKVYKVEKTLYGLHQAPRAWFQMSSMGALTFFLGLQVKQKEDEIFISQDKLMIGSLMYLTSSRQDIMFSVCACSRFQDSPLILEAFSDSDYAGASLDK
ncbi:putative ribonuclease H-like domain-containing protein, partial [Tanacetum coccineum]